MSAANAAEAADYVMVLGPAAVVGVGALSVAEQEWTAMGAMGNFADASRNHQDASPLDDLAALGVSSILAFSWFIDPARPGVLRFQAGQRVRPVKRRVDDARATALRHLIQPASSLAFMVHALSLQAIVPGDVCAALGVNPGTSVVEAVQAYVKAQGKSLTIPELVLRQYSEKFGTEIIVDKENEAPKKAGVTGKKRRGGGGEETMTTGKNARQRTEEMAIPSEPKMPCTPRTDPCRRSAVAVFGGSSVPTACGHVL